MPYASFKDLTWTGSIHSESELGQRHRFNVKDFITSRLNPSSFNSATCDAILVLNKSGGTLAKGHTVLPSTTASYGFPYAVQGVAGTAFMAGVVSPWIPEATVANGEAFWLIVNGFTEIAHTGTGNVTIGARIELGASGRVTVFGSGVVCGFAHEASNAPAAGTLFQAYILEGAGND